MNIYLKILTLSVILLGAGSDFRSTGQSLLGRTREPGAVLPCGERRVHLEPEQELGTVDLLDGRITFLTRVRFIMVLPFGQPLEMVVPAGTTWPIPSGKYKLDNPTNSPIDFVLSTDVGCGNNTSNEGNLQRLRPNPE